MFEPIYFHEFTHKNCDNITVTDLIAGTESAITRLMKFYVNEDCKLVTLWCITDIHQVDTEKYHKVRIIN